jgi:predicted ferric reductase
MEEWRCVHCLMYTFVTLNALFIHTLCDAFRLGDTVYLVIRVSRMVVATPCRASAFPLTIQHHEDHPYHIHVLAPLHNSGALLAPLHRPRQQRHPGVDESKNTPTRTIPPVTY